MLIPEGKGFPFLFVGHGFEQWRHRRNSEILFPVDGDFPQAYGNKELLQVGDNHTAQHDDLVFLRGIYPFEDRQTGFLCSNTMFLWWIAMAPIRAWLKYQPLM